MARNILFIARHHSSIPIIEQQLQEKNITNVVVKPIGYKYDNSLYIKVMTDVIPNKKATILDMCSVYETCGLPKDIRDFNAVKKPRIKGEKDIDDIEKAKQCPICKAVSPIAEFTVHNETTPDAIITTTYCPNCDEVCDETIVDLTQVDELVKIEDIEIKELSNKERKKGIEHLIEECTGANLSWSHYILGDLRKTDRLLHLDQQLQRQVTPKTKWTHIMKLYESAQEELKK